MSGKSLALLIGGVIVTVGLCVTGVVVVFTAGIFGIFASTAPAVEATERFLTLLGEGKVDEAYKSTANTLQTQETQISFRAKVQWLKLTEYASCTWTNRSIHADNQVTQAKLDGTFKTKAGESFPLKVELIKEGDAWRVLSLNVPNSAPMPADALKKQIPPDDELRRLVTATMLEFNKAVKANDFTAFHGTLATPFQKEQSPASLRQAFQQFIDQKIDIGNIKDLPPVFNEAPTLDAQQSLALSGFYAAPREPVNFQLKYSYEHPAWKLNSINVRVGK